MYAGCMPEKLVEQIVGYDELGLPSKAVPFGCGEWLPFDQQGSPSETMPPTRGLCCAYFAASSKWATSAKTVTLQGAIHWGSHAHRR